MVPVKQVQVTFDGAEPERVARFWCEVLGYVLPSPTEPQDSWSAGVDPAGVGPILALGNALEASSASTDNSRREES